MKVSFPAKEKLLFDLFSLEGWEGFDVGSSDDFEKEVEMTAQNQELMTFLERRRSQRRRIPMADVKRQPGLS